MRGKLFKLEMIDLQVVEEYKTCEFGQTLKDSHLDTKIIKAITKIT
jgi:hypothetical protein